jgi:hypothetical protein
MPRFHGVVRCLRSSGQATKLPTLCVPLATSSVQSSQRRNISTSKEIYCPHRTAAEQRVATHMGTHESNAFEVFQKLYERDYKDRYKLSRFLEQMAKLAELKRSESHAGTPGAQHETEELKVDHLAVPDVARNLLLKAHQTGYLKSFSCVFADSKRLFRRDPVTGNHYSRVHKQYAPANDQL